MEVYLLRHIFDQPQNVFKFLAKQTGIPTLDRFD